MTVQLNTDHYFVIGYGHSNTGMPCQDHALSGIHNGRAFAVVSDGCSGRGTAHTDVGARLITLETRRLLCEFPRVEEPYWSDLAMRSRVIHAALELGLQGDDLLATQLYAVIDENHETAFARVLGDGLVVRAWDDGLLCIDRFDWPNERPYYTMYGRSPNEWIAGHGGEAAQVLRRSDYWFKPAEGAEPFRQSEITYSVAEGMAGITVPIPNLDRLKFVALFSDGAWKIDQIDWLDAVKQMTAYKNWAGNFVKRRMNRYVNETRKIGHGPIDDLSCAVIHIENATDAA